MTIRHSLTTTLVVASLAAPAMAADDVIKRGTEAEGKLEQSISSANAHEGDHFVLDLKRGLTGAATATAVVLAMPGSDLKLDKGTTLKVKFDEEVALSH